MIMEFQGHGGKMYLWNSEGKGKLKYWSYPWYGMDLFWNCQILESDFAIISSPDFSINSGDGVNRTVFIMPKYSSNCTISAII